MAKIQGIDISYWQGNINFKEVAAVRTLKLIFQKQ